MKPLIAITPECAHDPEDNRTRGIIELNWNYAEAVSQAGGIPIVVPPTADMVEIARLVDGWLIPGGRDIDSSEFGEPLHAKANLQDPARFASERALYSAASPDMPILGICYGCQFINVVSGGSIEQELSDTLGPNTHDTGEMQSCSLKAESKIAAITRASHVEGKSYHHQAIARVGQGLEVSATHEDGTIEAVEGTDGRWLIGVQWHPERTAESAATRRLFKAFIDAASAYKRAKEAAR